MGEVGGHRALNVGFKGGTGTDGWGKGLYEELLMSWPDKLINDSMVRALKKSLVLHGMRRGCLTAFRTGMVSQCSLQPGSLSATLQGKGDVWPHLLSSGDKRYLKVY